MDNKNLKFYTFLSETRRKQTDTIRKGNFTVCPYTWVCSWHKIEVVCEPGTEIVKRLLKKAEVPHWCCLSGISSFQFQVRKTVSGRKWHPGWGDWNNPRVSKLRLDPRSCWPSCRWKRISERRSCLFGLYVYVYITTQNVQQEVYSACFKMHASITCFDSNLMAGWM